MAGIEAMLAKIQQIFQKLELKVSNSGGSDGVNWYSSSHHQPLKSYNPTNEAVLASVKLCSIDDYQHIIAQAQQSFLKWRTIPAPVRGDLIRQIGQILRQIKDDLAILITFEMGKSIEEAKGEVQEMIDMADFSVGQSRMLYGKTMHSERPLHRMYEQWHPLGVVGVITAFNFPVAVWAWNAFLAVVTGNTVIWKPSSKTPLCAIAVQHICNQVMAKNGYSGVFSVFIPENHTVAEDFVNDSRVALISFTGSTVAGKKINELISKRLGRSLLEMSGNNAVIIDESANLNLAIPAIIFGALGTAGQRCTTIRRLIVHTSLYEAVINQLIHAYKQIKVGDPLNTKHLMGPLINQAAVKNFIRTLKEVELMGGRILYGGEIIDTPGYFVTPALVQAENSWPVVQQETFGPILYVFKFEKFSDAIDLQNAVRQGLSSALFTEKLQHAEYFLSTMGSDCGIANINIGTSGAEIGGAFGGEKDTGGGREAGSDAWKNYMRRQTNTINWGSLMTLAQGVRFHTDI